MDSLITAAAHALAAGDPLGALKRIALRDDAPALALRGIAMAQLGDLARAKALLSRAIRRLRSERSSRPRALRRRRGGDCARLARFGLAREGARGGADNARGTRRPDQRRARAVSRGAAPPLIGRLDEAERTARRPRFHALPPASRTAHELVVAGIAIRRLRTKAARAALVRAERAARHAGIPGTDGGGRARVSRPQHTGGAPDREWRGAAAPARGGRSVAGGERRRRRCVPSCRA